MISGINLMFSWLPTVLQLLFAGIVSVFLIWAVVKIVTVVLDLIPFI